MTIQQLIINQVYLLPDQNKKENYNFIFEFTSPNNTLFDEDLKELLISNFFQNKKNLSLIKYINYDEHKNKISEEDILNELSKDLFEEDKDIDIFCFHYHENSKYSAVSTKK